ncbi:MAG: hypothetical protein JOZ69_14580 [Myxococcales bacterium]|nr:hypothetical protein [Myxococcales bacterium]
MDQPTARKPHPLPEPAPSFDRNPSTATATHATAEAGVKLKQAEAKLAEAEASLMSPAPPRPSGAPLHARTTEPPPHAPELAEEAPTVPFTDPLPENVAAMLCYLFAWVGGLVFLFVDRRPFVRFHAAQSVAIFATLNILLLALSGFFLGTLIPGLAGALLIVRRLLELAWLVAMVVLMLKAAGGEWFRVKIASQYADRAARAAR